MGRIILFLLSLYILIPPGHSKPRAYTNKLGIANDSYQKVPDIY